jgi:amidohydrolase
MLERAREIESKLVAWRREFHAHPELGFRETRTAARVAEELRALGYRVQVGVGRTGVLAERGDGRPVVAVRADMDALPIEEENEVPYASQVPGVMHACGHDAHVAMGLGVATLLAEEAFPGTLRLLFQPAEELEDEEGISGAPRMIEDGALDGVSAVLALHVAAALATGDVAVQSGSASAGVDTFYATVIGRGAHGARPHEGVDPILLAGHVVLALHGIVSRRLDPCEPAVVSVGSIHGGHADNVIPDHVDLSGTLRFTTAEARDRIHAEVGRALEVARALGGDYRLRIVSGCPPVVNDPEMVELLRRVAVDLLGKEHVRLPVRAMGAEDFSFFSALAPGAMFRLGCQIEGDERRAHSPRFDLDERCLPIGTAVLSEAALRLLRS